MCNTCGCKKAESFEAEEFVAEGKKVKSVIENAMKEYDKYVADKKAYDDDDIISFEEWFDWHLGDDELDGDEETLEYLKTLPSYNSLGRNSWIWKMYHGDKYKFAEEKKKIEEDERRTQAEKTFLAWKEEKTKELKERYLAEKKKQKEKRKG